MELRTRLAAADQPAVGRGKDRSVVFSKTDLIGDSALQAQLVLSPGQDLGDNGRNEY